MLVETASVFYAIWYKCKECEIYGMKTFLYYTFRERANIWNNGNLIIFDI